MTRIEPQQYYEDRNGEAAVAGDAHPLSGPASVDKIQDGKRQDQFVGYLVVFEIRERGIEKHARGRHHDRVGKKRFIDHPGSGAATLCSRDERRTGTATSLQPERRTLSNRGPAIYA